MSRIKVKNSKVKLVSLKKIAEKASIDNEFVFIEDPCYELDDLPVDLVIELK